MRIISGIAAGIRLEVPPGKNLRPTADRVKESLFASLGDLRGQRVADLFAGTGALGLEAISRGAASVTFIENNPRHQKTLLANIERVRKAISQTVPPPETIVRRDDARHPHRILPHLAGRLDLILMDPPYRESAPGGALHAWLCDADIANWARPALLVLEHPRHSPLPWHPLGHWRPIRQKQYGDTLVTHCRTVDPQ